MMMMTPMNNNNINNNNKKMFSTTTITFLFFVTPFVVTNANIAQECIDRDCFGTIDSSQDCLRMCTIETPSPNPHPDLYGNRLQQCTDQDYTGADKTDFVELVTCCGMDGNTSTSTFVGSNCDTTMDEAQYCASINGCIDPCIVDKARNYMNCVREKKSIGQCPWSEWCMGRLFNDPQLNSDGSLSGIRSIDFNDILGPAASDAIDTQSCAPFGPFVDTVCRDIGDLCCEYCEAELGELTECLVNNFVLPIVEAKESSTLGLQCSFNTSVGGCGLTTIDALTDPDASTSGTTTPAPASSPDSIRRRNLDAVAADENDIDMSECEAALSGNWLLHNASYAAGEFMNCNAKTLATIIIADDEESSATEKEKSTNSKRKPSSMATTTTTFVGSSIASLLFVSATIMMI